MPTPFVSLDSNQRSRQVWSDLPPEPPDIPGTHAHVWLNRTSSREPPSSSTLHLRNQGLGTQMSVNLGHHCDFNSPGSSETDEKGPAEVSGRGKGSYCPTRALRARLLHAYTSSQPACHDEGSTIWSPRGMVPVIKSMKRRYPPKATFQYRTRDLEEPWHSTILAPAPDGYAFRLASSLDFVGLWSGLV